MITYSPMLKSETSECAELAAQAFATYEYFTNYFPDADRRLDFLRKVIKSEYLTNYGHAVFLVGKQEGRIVAVTQILPPDYKKPNDFAYLIHGWWRVLAIRPKEPVNDWLTMDEKAGAYCHQLMKDGMWYISSLTISPDCQGQGIGSDIIENCIIPYIRQHGGKRMCLFTNSEKNVRFYTKCGFEIIDRQTISYNGHEMGSWSFTKDITRP